MIKKPCRYCMESGLDPNRFKSMITGQPPSICSVCQGRAFNVFDCLEEDLIDCKPCEGTGKIEGSQSIFIFNKCGSCKGTGYRNQNTDEFSTIYNFWQLIDERIVNVAKPRFDNKQYADSVEAAFKEINSIVKAIVNESIGKEYDGKNLMERAFSPDDPVIKLNELKTESDINIQKGFLLLFSGSMLGIRNPKTHSNRTISKELAIHYLFLASLLMSKIPK